MPEGEKLYHGRKVTCGSDSVDAYFRDNGKENGTTLKNWCYLGIMKKKMATTIGFWCLAMGSIFPPHGVF